MAIACGCHPASLPAGSCLAAGLCVALTFVVASPVRAQAGDPGAVAGTPTAEPLPFRSEPPLRSYVAIRRLESANDRHDKEAWLVARTELREDGSFHYEVLDEGGSEFIRNKVLHEALEKEQDVHTDGSAQRAGLTRENYAFSAPTTSGGLVHVGLVPRRKADMLLKGTLVASPEGEILRVEGDLVKRPSFWTRSVHIVREYDRIAGAHVPVRLDTTAQVRFVGVSTLRVTYDYLEINGRAVPGRRETGYTVRARQEPRVQ